MADAKNSLFEFDLNKALAQFQIPGVDMEALMTLQRKNIEALTLANQLTSEAMQIVSRRQAELAQESMKEAQGLLNDIAQAGAPGDMVAKQVEIAKNAFDKGIASTRELTDIVTQAQMTAFNVISKRFSDSFTEFHAVTKVKPTP
jgi:phasin family protein